MTRLIEIAGFVLTGLIFIGTAQAELLTGCVTNGGALKNVAEGEEPTQPCGPTEALVQWETAGGQAGATCPCDIKSAVYLAGWDMPKCHVGSEDTSLADQFGADLMPGVHVTDFIIIEYRMCEIWNGHGNLSRWDIYDGEFTEEQFRRLQA